MGAALGIYLAACALLAAAGAAKVLRPHDSALAAVRLWPALRPRRALAVVRVFAAVEAGLGLAGLAYPDPVVAGLAALSFAAFAAVVCYARARGGPLATCGCFATPDTPPTRTHALVDAVLAAGAAAYGAAGAAAALPSLLARQYASGWPLAAAALSCAWAAFVAMVRLPRLQSAARQALDS